MFLSVRMVVIFLMKIPLARLLVQMLLQHMHVFRAKIPKCFVLHFGICSLL